jgi:hypothetical protein
MQLPQSLSHTVDGVVESMRIHGPTRIILHRFFFYKNVSVSKWKEGFAIFLIRRLFNSITREEKLQFA